MQARAAKCALVVRHARRLLLERQVSLPAGAVPREQLGLLLLKVRLVLRQLGLHHISTLRKKDSTTNREHTKHQAEEAC